MASFYYFNAIDYCIMVFTLVCFIAIGLYYRVSGGRQKTTEEYLMADRKLSALPVSLSMVVTVVSAMSILGNTEEFYSRGSIYLLAYVSVMAMTPVRILLYLPVFFNLKRVSTYEYLELRFGKKIRLIASLMYTLQMLLLNGVVLYAPAITLEAITGLSKLTSILLTGVVCVFYSTIGGMKAIVMTDILQAIIMVAAVVSVIIVATLQVGGFGNIFEIALQHGRLSFNNFDPTERHTWFSLLIGNSIAIVCTISADHISTQRLQTVKTLKEAQISGFLSLLLMTMFTLLIWVSAMALFAVYSQCDPVADGKIANIDQLITYFVMTSMQLPGLGGLFVAGIFSATLSTLSAACNGLAALVTKDYMPHLENRFGGLSLSGIVANKVSAFVIGLLIIAFAFLTEYLGGLFQAAFSILSTFGGPLLGVFTLGMFTTTANEKGTIIGLLAGLVLTSWKSFGGPRPPIKSLPVVTESCSNATLHRLASVAATMTTPKPDAEYFYLYRISYQWISGMGLITVLIVGYIASRFLNQRQPWESNQKDMQDFEGLPDPCLFTPILASRVRRRNEEILARRILKGEMLPLNP